MPDGISLRLDGTETVPLNPQPFNRRDYEDYTLMCWFRTTEPNTTLMSNGEARDEEGYKNHFNIGLENGKLYFRSGGQQVTDNGYYCNNTWHHAAVTINRSRNVGNLYVDQKLKQTFPVDTLGGIGGNGLCLGNSDGMAVSIDEVAMFEMALPENVLKRMTTQTPTGIIDPQFLLRDYDPRRSTCESVLNSCFCQPLERLTDYKTTQRLQHLLQAHLDCAPQV